MGAVVACATCGTELREIARFCDSCRTTAIAFTGRIGWAEAMT
jgi:hypothetical protein